MIETTNLETFVAHNDRDLRRYLRSRGIWDEDKLNDIIQSFYLKVKAEDLLAKYNPEKGVYSNYVFVILSSVISNYFKKNKPVPEQTYKEEHTDIWQRIRDFRDYLIKQPHADQLLNDFNRRLLGNTDRTCANTILYCQTLKIFKTLEMYSPGVTGFQGAF